MARLPNDDWQSRKSIAECNQYMLTNKLNCDVTFIVGPNQSRIGAHKYVLASRSCVFYAMFYGPLSGNTGDVVTLPDMTPDQLNCLLDFAYKDDVKITLQNVMAMLYAAKKYCIQSLIDRCLNTLKRSMNPVNVCTVMENAHMFGNSELKAKCMNLIMQDPEEVFDADDLGELCEECFANIIGDDKLPVSEEKIFAAVLKYARARCPPSGTPPTDEALRNKIKTVITKVRFPLMEEQYFSDEVEPRKLLTENQVLQVYRYFIKKTASACPDFNSKKRKCQYTAQRFSDVVSGWGYKRDNRDAISFTCSHDILVNGVQVYGSDQAPAELDIYIHLKQQPYGTNVAVKRFLIETDGKQKTYKLLFDNPARLSKDVHYTLEAVIRGSTTYYGSSGEELVESGNVEIRFQDSKRSTNNTCVKRGQIPAIIFELKEDTNQVVMETGQ